MKKIFSLTACVLIFSACEAIDYDEYYGSKSSETQPVMSTFITYDTPVASTTEDLPDESDILKEILVENGTPRFSDSSLIESEYGVCYNLSGRELIYGKNLDNRIYPASITKLLTALVAIEKVPEDFEFIVGSEIDLISEDSSVARLKEGQILDLKGIITALILPSGNDAAYTIAVNVARGQVGEDHSDEEMASYFVNLMNEYAKRIGANGSNFRNPDGYHDDEHFSTIRDLLKISVAASENKLLCEICGKTSADIKFISGENASYENNHNLMKSDVWDVRGLKTGVTDQAGYCFAGYVVINDEEYITVVSGSDDANMRDSDTIKLFEMAESGKGYYNARLE
ncbi:MAG: hypothetical protein LBR74_01880 [Eubacterium sp.]|jgi:D-alanyl-D-alanine carboxypeptidase (penicillin-binding protein 5/6)|nr:hypothetical protein [Eubacterium sp.]